MSSLDLTPQLFAQTASDPSPNTVLAGLSAQELALTILAIVLSYIAGSIPFGLLVGWAKGVDVRQHGSGNTGATNVGRTIGKPYGFLVFALDFLKGFGPVLLVWLYTRYARQAFLRDDLVVLCALVAVLGHVFPVWLRFQGGKAGATSLGVGAVLSPWSMLIALCVFVSVVLMTRYVSLGTLLGAAAYVISYYVQTSLEYSPFDREHISMSIFTMGIAVLLAVRHKGNIHRLLTGTERRASFSSRRTHNGKAHR